MIAGFFIVLASAIVLLPFLRVNAKGILSLLTVSALAVLSSIPALQALFGNPLDFVYSGTSITGRVSIVLDALSAWFILIINFTLVTGAFYGLQYMKAYRERGQEISMHCIAYLLVHSMLIVLTVVQNSLVFLFALEIMALSAFLLVIFEHEKAETLKAGLNYFIQSHLSIVFLTIGFLWVASHSGTFDFSGITTFVITHPSRTALVLFLTFFIGFAFKSGFVPFHTWLPYAHPAAPSHVSGVMSGVIIKIGIYGLLRIILLMPGDRYTMGILVLCIAVFTGLYGIMLAVLQKNIKKFLAYSSIENIGIIGIGIGLGTIGMACNNTAFMIFGFGGALLHVFSHSLMKSLLFFASGSIYQSVHSLNMDEMGGLIKRMPRTALLFLAGSLAICGFPPLNGFVSEFLIYIGIYNGLTDNAGVPLLLLLFSLFGLVMIGGLAFFGFSKTFSITFLGNPRKSPDHAVSEASMHKLWPLYLILALMLCVGIFPGLIMKLVNPGLKLFMSQTAATADFSGIEHTTNLMSQMGMYAALFIALCLILLGLRYLATRRKSQREAATWGCGYTGDASGMQYSSASYIRTYRKLAAPVLRIGKKKNEVNGLFPAEGSHEITTWDKLEHWLIHKPLKLLLRGFDRFSFLQNGKTQYYVLYGVIFIVLVTVIPYLYRGLQMLLAIINYKI
jgi:formate hydrogenlyase subunit 3/multisubunit Na+/H+ antiporter MnhD subunit